MQFGKVADASVSRPINLLIRIYIRYRKELGANIGKLRARVRNPNNTFYLEEVKTIYRMFFVLKYRSNFIHLSFFRNQPNYSKK
jgi:hypothetical protein